MKILSKFKVFLVGFNGPFANSTHSVPILSITEEHHKYCYPVILQFKSSGKCVWRVYVSNPMELIRNKLYPNLIQITEKALYINLGMYVRTHTKTYFSDYVIFRQLNFSGN